MKKYCNLQFHKRVVLDIQRLKDLDRILLKQCGHLNYTIMTKSKNRVLFDSFDELIAYPNFGEERITCLEITGYSSQLSSNEIVSLAFSPITPYESYTVKGRYCITDIDKESIFKADINSFLDKATRNQNSFKACEIISWLFFVVVGFYPMMLPLYKVYKHTYPKVMLIFLSQMIAHALYAIVRFLILPRVFPRVVFAWGEEEKRNEWHEKLRSNLFWAVLIPLLIAVVVPCFIK